MKWTLTVLLGTIWGASYLFIAVGGAEIPPITFVAGRVLIAGITIGLILLLRREGFPPFRRNVWLPLLVMGLTNGVIPYTLITWGETQIPSGLAGILVATMPIFTVIMAHFMTRDERLTPYKSIGIAIGFVGVVILFLPDLRDGFSLSVLGALVTILAAVSYGFATVFAHKYLRGISNLGAEFGQMATASALLVPASLLLNQPWTLRPSPPALGSLLTLALLGTAFAYMIYYWLIEHAGPTSTSLVTYISPVSAVFLGVVFRHEVFDWTAVVGFLGIVGGVALVSHRSPEAARPPVGAEAD